MSTSFTLQTLVPEMVALAQQAGEAVMHIYSQAEVAPIYKDSGFPLTRADIASNDLIERKLRSLTPNIPVLSEESQTVPYDVRRLWRTFWLVDPLDGTKEFIQRNGEFTINIALVNDGQPILGVVHAPALNVTYLAGHRLGAFKQDGRAQTRQITVRKCDGMRFQVAVSRSHAGTGTKKFLDKIGAVDCISMGSSLKFCLVAEGAAHVYPRLGPTMEWDSAAAQCIVEAAGGVVTDLQGQTLVYNKADLVNPYFIVSGDPSFSWDSYIEGENDVSDER